ncbi:MAG: class I SAM-dependent methyltransferase [Erysipelotrichaceae bacterium]
MINLSKRLRAIHDLVDKGSIVADIGSDHALLACALIESETSPYVYASDIAAGPLSHAQSTILAYAMDLNIETIRSDGLHELVNQVDTIVIAGMGSDTIIHILEQDYDKVLQAKSIIIQSNTHVFDIRRWISDHHLQIVDEVMVKESHYYQIIKVDVKEGNSLTEDEILFGKIIKDKNIFIDYWNFRLNNLNSIINRLKPDHASYQKNLILKERIINKINSLT